MRILDTLLGRTKPAQANLDALFALPSAAITLQAEAGLQLTGRAAICFKPGAGQPFDEIQTEITQLLSADGKGQGGAASDPGIQSDNYGYRWMVLEDPDPSELVTRVHVVNSTLQDHGYGPQLLCSVFALSEGAPSGSQAAAKAYLVYLYKRGSFYPFAPNGKERRDNELELRLRALVGEDLHMEEDLSRWFSLWGMPL